MSDVPSPPAGRRARSEETWAQARDDYAAGFSAVQVCARYDIGLRAFRDRARREGWRRADLPDPEPACFEEEDAADHGPPTSGEDLAAVARRAAARAVRRGRLAEARGWLKLTRELMALAGDERDAAAFARSCQAAEIRRAAEAIRAELHSAHSVHPENPDEPEDEDAGD
ncbi:MAG: hypothetical protein WDM92_01285 [Caulobacteraceae bacterium]